MWLSLTHGPPSLGFETLYEFGAVKSAPG